MASLRPTSLPDSVMPTWKEKGADESLVCLSMKRISEYFTVVKVASVKPQEPFRSTVCIVTFIVMSG